MTGCCWIDSLEQYFVLSLIHLHKPACFAWLMLCACAMRHAFYHSSCVRRQTFNSENINRSKIHLLLMQSYFVSSILSLCKLTTIPSQVFGYNHGSLYIHNWKRFHKALNWWLIDKFIPFDWDEFRVWLALRTNGKIE